MSKIAVVSTLNVLEDPRIFYKIILSLKKEYDDITYIVKSSKKVSFVKDGVKIEPIPIEKSIIKRFLYQHWIAIYKILNGKYDLIQFNNPEFIVWAYFLKVFFKKKIVFDVHENFAKSFEDKTWLRPLFRKVIAFIYPRLEKKITEKFDAIIIAESSYREYYGERAIELLNYPIIINNYNKNKDHNREVRKFVYVGGIMENRRIWELLDIFKIIHEHISNSKLLLVGPFAPEDLEFQVRKKLNEYNLANCVEILGRQPLPKVYDLLEEVDFGFSLLKPIGNYYESLSTKIFDYMTFGIPFAVSNFPIYQKYVVDKRTGIVVNESNIEETAKKILEVVNSKKTIEEMSNNGVFQTQKHWNWANEEKKLLRLYKEIL